MPDASIKVVVGADTSQAQAGLKNLTAAVSSINNDIKATGQQFAFTNDQVNKGAVQADKLASTFKNADAIVGILNKDVGELASSLEAQNSQFGAAADGIEKFAESAKKASNPLTDAYSAVRKLAYALPGIGVAGILGAAFEGVVAIVESFTDAAAQAEAAQKKLNETLGAGSASVQGEVSAMKDLAVIALDTANSTQTRSKAFSELQEKYPGYLGNLSLEKSSYDDIQTALDKVTQALIRQAQIKGLEDAITDTYKELNKTIADGGTTFQKVTSNIAGFVAGITDAQGGVDGFVKAFDKAKSGSIQHGLDVDTTNAQGQVDALNKKLSELLKSSIENNDALLKPAKSGKLPVTDALNDEIAALEKLESLVPKINAPLASAFAASIDEDKSTLLSDKIAQLIRDNAQKGIKKSITDREVQLMQDQLAKLINPDLKSKSNIEIQLNPELIQLNKDNKAFGGDIAPQLTDLIEKLPPLKPKITIDPDLLANAKEINKKIETFKNTFSSSIINVGVGIAEDIGKAFAGQKNPFGNLADLLGEGLEEIGKQLLIVGGLSALIQKLLPTVFTPAGAVTSIIVGGLAIAAGAALKSISSKKGVALAEGGIVTGPTNALIGEGGQPEVVFPLDKLNRFIKGANSSPSMNVGGQFTVAGNDLKLVLSRTNKNQSYVG